MARPNINKVKEWHLESDSQDVQVYYGTAVFEDDYFKVVSDGKPEYFYGEFAWADAERYANFLRFKKIYS